MKTNLSTFSQLSPQAHSFFVNEFINSAEILGNKLISMDYLKCRIILHFGSIFARKAFKNAKNNLYLYFSLLASKNLLSYYTSMRLFLRNIDSFKDLEQNFMKHHGEFYKHYYETYRSYLPIFFKGLKFFSNLEQTIKKILDYNYYQTTPIIITLKANSNITSSQNIFVKAYQIYQSLLFEERKDDNDSIIVSSLKTLMEDLADIQNEIDTAINKTLLLRRYTDSIFRELRTIKYDIEDLINYHEYPFGSIMYMITNFKMFNKDKKILEKDLIIINLSKKSLSNLNLELDNIYNQFKASKEYLEAYQAYLKVLWEDMKVIEKKELDEGEVKRFEKVLIGIKENYKKVSSILSAMKVTPKRN
jgi:hypothetical protein